MAERRSLPAYSRNRPSLRTGAGGRAPENVKAIILDKGETNSPVFPRAEQGPDITPAILRQAPSTAALNLTAIPYKSFMLADAVFWPS